MINPIHPPPPKCYHTLGGESPYVKEWLISVLIEQSAGVIKFNLGNF